MKDYPVKKVMSHKWMMGLVLKGFIPEFKEYDLDFIIHHCFMGNGNYVDGIRNESQFVNYDVICKVKVPQTNEVMIVNVEIQNIFNPGYSILKRAGFYNAEMIHDQKGTEFINSNYDDIKKVYSIWLCLHPTKRFENGVARIRSKEHIDHGNIWFSEKESELSNSIMVCFGKEDMLTHPIMHAIYCILSEEISMEAKQEMVFKDLGIKIPDDLLGEVSKMCDFEVYLLNKGETIGIAKGKEQGLAEGKVQKEILFIQKLLDTTDWDFNQILDFVEVDDNRRSYYRELFNV